MAVKVHVIIDEVCKRRGNVTKDDLLSRNRSHRFVDARHLVAYVAKVTTNYSISAIGRYMGGRDHSTIFNSLRQARKKLREDPSYEKEVSEVCNAVLDRCIIAKNPPNVLQNVVNNQ